MTRTYLFNLYTHLLNQSVIFCTLQTGCLCARYACVEIRFARVTEFSIRTYIYITRHRRKKLVKISLFPHRRQTTNMVLYIGIATSRTEIFFFFFHSSPFLCAIHTLMILYYCIGRYYVYNILLICRVHYNVTCIVLF